MCKWQQGGPGRMWYVQILSRAMFYGYRIERRICNRKLIFQLQIDPKSAFQNHHKWLFFFFLFFYLWKYKNLWKINFMQNYAAVSATYVPRFLKRLFLIFSLFTYVISLSFSTAHMISELLLLTCCTVEIELLASLVFLSDFFLS